MIAKSPVESSVDQTGHRSVVFLAFGTLSLVSPRNWIMARGDPGGIGTERCFLARCLDRAGNSPANRELGASGDWGDVDVGSQGFWIRDGAKACCGQQEGDGGLDSNSWQRNQYLGKGMCNNLGGHQSRWALSYLIWAATGIVTSKVAAPVRRSYRVGSARASKIRSIRTEGSSPSGY